MPTQRLLGQRILVIEDEATIASLIRLYLERDGFEVHHAADGSSALDAFRAVDPSLVILDLMLPGMDGTQICERIRDRSDTPIIMLTARDDELDRVLGLELGADDYVTKPFSPRELVARVRAVLRRTDPSPQARVVVGPVEVDPPRREVVVDGEQVDLTAREFDLLLFMMTNQGIVCTREMLLTRVWGYERVVDTRTVDTHVRSLRQKLGAGARIVGTVRGVGYRVDDRGDG